MSAQKRLLDDLLVRGELQVFERVHDEQHRTNVRVDLRTLVPTAARPSILRQRRGGADCGTILSTPATFENDDRPHVYIQLHSSIFAFMRSSTLEFRKLIRRNFATIR